MSDLDAVVVRVSPPAQPSDPDVDPDDDEPPSTPRRRKRGTRKGKGGGAAPIDDTLQTLAAASQSLAREISKSSRPSSVRTSSSSQQLRPGFEPVSIFPVPTALCSPALSAASRPSNASTPSWRSLSSSKLSLPATNPPAALPAAPTVVKKSSKWKLGFAKASSARNYLTSPDSPDAIVDPRLYGVAMSATASNVSDLIMGLTRPPPPPAPAQPSPLHRTRVADDNDSTRSSSSRGRQRGRNSSRSRSRNSSAQTSISSDHPAFHFNYDQSRAISPSSAGQTSSGGSMSSAVTSTSALSRFSSGSVGSLSTSATSASSSSSWRNPRNSPTSPDHPAGLPRNVKYITEMPRELSEQRPTDSDIFGRQPRKQRSRKMKDSKLDTITERPITSPRSPQPRKDASTSTSELDAAALDEDGDARGRRGTLTKMLSALRR